MLPGYNTDVQHDGSSYHIQTEDNGEANPYIVTLIYQGGAILARRKTDYSHLLSSAKAREDVRRLMQEQHREMIALIKEGKLESAAPPPLPEEEKEGAPTSGTLDEAIMHFLAEIGD